jgi:hypothetical protein
MAATLTLPENETAIWDGRLALTARVGGLSAVPERNPALVAVAQEGRRLTLEQAEDLVAWRSIAADRVRHAFAGAVNPPQPL